MEIYYARFAMLSRWPGAEKGVAALSGVPVTVVEVEGAV